MATRITEAQIKAKKKWAEKNKEKTKYITEKSKCKGFIYNYLTLEDMEEVKQWIKEREQQLKITNAHTVK